MLDKSVPSAHHSGSADSVTSYRHQILQQLLKNKKGLQIDELSAYLCISRTAVQKHFLLLEKEGLIKKHSRIKTLGRPSINYVLTSKGIEYFPKRYALISGILLQELKNELGSDQLTHYMKRLGQKLAQQYWERFEGKNEAGQLDTLFELMQELGFYVSMRRDSDSQETELSAHNCIYHDVAQQFEEICMLDQNLITELLNKKVELRSCMAKGDGICCFRIRSEKDKV